MGAMNDFSGMTQNMAQLMSMQMGMVNKELQSTQELHRTLGALVKKLDSLIEKNDTPGFTSKVSSCMTDIVGSIEQLSERLESPNINVDFPNDDLKAMKKAIEALKFEGIEEVTVKNISDVTKAVNELKPLLVNLEQAIEVEKKTTEAVQLDPKSLKYLKYLENLDTDAKNPLAVRLSDGKEFINQLKSVDSGIRAMTGSSGNNFLTSTGSPTKANLDADGNLKVNISAGSSSGTQYADGDARGTATGTLAMGDDGTNIQSIKVDASGELQVDVLSTVTPVPTTSGGCLVANFNTGDTFTALTNSAQVIKASAGQLYGYYIYNPNATATYVMLYNIAAASVTVGTSTPQMVFCIPATSGANLDLTHGIEFTNAGWSIAAATTGGGNTSPASALEAMVFYK